MPPRYELGLEVAVAEVAGEAEAVEAGVEAVTEGVAVAVALLVGDGSAGVDGEPDGDGLADGEADGVGLSDAAIGAADGVVTLALGRAGLVLVGRAAGEV